MFSHLPEGFVGIGVSFGTDGFVQNFAAKTCREITDDVEKLDAIQGCFIHYQLLLLNELLKRGTKQHADGWDASSKARAHVVLHLPHAEGGFGVTFNDITKDNAFYTTASRFVGCLGAFSQERQGLWCILASQSTLAHGNII